MAKLIVLRLIGNLQEQGYKVTLELSYEGKRPYADETGHLPANPSLTHKITHHWSDKYRNLVAPYRRKHWPVNEAPSDDFATRIKPKKITYSGHINAQIQECKASANELQAMFLEWLNAPGFRPIENCLRTNLNRGEVTRFLIRTEDMQVQKLPWHAWELFKVFEAEPSFSSPRIQPTPKLGAPAHKCSVKILAILGHSEGIDVQADEQLLQKLAPDTEFLVEPTRKEISDRLWTEPWDIVFFAGHSETEGDTGKIYINPDEYLTVEELWYGLRKAVEKGLQVAIFNSCDGLGLAQKLINDFQIPNLIVMRELVPDQVAQEFLKYFLSAFEGGRPFHLAAREARERLQGMENQYPCASWLPTTYQNPLEEALYWRELTAPPEEAVPSEATPTEDNETSTSPGFRRLTWKDVRRLTATSLLVTSLVMGIRWSGVLEPMELGFYDHLMRARPTEQADHRLLIIGGTEEDTREYSHPFPDHVLAELLQKIDKYNPAAIGLSIIRDRPEPAGAEQEHEKLLAMIRNNEKITTVCALGHTPEQSIAPPANVAEEQVAFTDLFLDADIVKNDMSIRRYQLYQTANPIDAVKPCKPHDSLGLKLATQYLKGKEIRADFINGQWLFGDSALPTLSAHHGMYQDFDDRGDQVLISYRNVTTDIAQTVSVKDVLQESEDFDPGWIEDRVVIIGMAASSLSTVEETPHGKMEILNIHAHLISQLISAAIDNRPLIRPLKLWQELCIVLGASISACVLALSTPNLIKLCIKIPVALGVVYGASWLSLTLLGGYVPFIPATLSFLVTLLIAAIGIINPKVFTSSVNLSKKSFR